MGIWDQQASGDGLKVRKISKMTSELTAELMMVPNKDRDFFDSDIRFEVPLELSGGNFCKQLKIQF